MDKYIKIAERDNVAVALEPLKAGESILGVTLTEDVPSGHKFALEDIAEGFHETVFIHGSYMPEIEKLMNAYEPDILVIENAEREDRTALWIQAAYRAGLEEQGTENR